MTLIAYRDGVMAADMVVWSGPLASGSREKIRRRDDGTIWATTGELVRGLQFEMAMKTWKPDDPRAFGCPACTPHEFAAIIVQAAGEVWRCDGHMFPYRAPPAEFYVIGLAMDFMAGALAAGANAVQAVRLAQLYTDTGARAVADIQVVRLKP